MRGERQKEIWVLAEKVSRVVFPFTAFVNHEPSKIALILNAINPRIGGVLIRGEKGSGKSTLVRGLAGLLPPIEVSRECPFSCSPYDTTNMCEVCRDKSNAKGKLAVKKKRMGVVTLPLGATEDMVVGTLDVEKALTKGVLALQPGILARANQSILYVDEINLLPDNIVDVILDAAALGWNYVEREGVSVSHPSRFVLVGTMNPEEGELRPQLLDRLPLSVSIGGLADEGMRVEVIKRNMEFSEHPDEFYKTWKEKEKEVQDRITNARQLLSKIEVPEGILHVVARMCMLLGIDGHRPDIIIVTTAKTLAAYEGRSIVQLEDVNWASQLALQHRTRLGGYEEPASAEQINEAFKKSVQETKQFFRES